MVASPEAISTVLAWKPTRIATSTVAGNMVRACWKPSRMICPMGGVSLGRYPMILVFDVALIGFSPGFLIFAPGVNSRSDISR